MVTKHYVSKKYYENINDKYKTPNDLYFIKDTGEIYRGTELYIDDCIFYNSNFLPKKPVVDKLYVNSSSLECKVFDGLKWTDYETPSDFKQNNPNKPDYIKNKPFSIDSIPAEYASILRAKMAHVIGTVSLNATNIEGENLKETYNALKITDYIFKESDIDRLSLYVADFNEDGELEAEEYPASIIGIISEGEESIGCDKYDDNYVIYLSGGLYKIPIAFSISSTEEYTTDFVASENNTVNITIKVPEPGTYLCPVMDDEMLEEVTHELTDEERAEFEAQLEAGGDEAFKLAEVKDIKKIDQELLPNADYNQNDPNGAGYIENRPFFLGDAIPESESDFATIDLGHPASVEDELHRYMAESDGDMVSGDIYRLKINDVKIDFDAYITKLGGQDETIAFGPDKDKLEKVIESQNESMLFSLSPGFGAVNAGNSIMLIIYNKNLFKNTFNLTDLTGEIKITHLTREIKKLDKRFLPDEINANANNLCISLADLGIDSMSLNTDYPVPDKVMADLTKAVDAGNVILIRPFSGAGTETSTLIASTYQKLNNEIILNAINGTTTIRATVNTSTKKIRFTMSNDTHRVESQTMSSTTVKFGSEDSVTFNNGFKVFDLDTMLGATIDNIINNSDGSYTATNKASIFTEFTNAVNGALHPVFEVKSKGSLMLFPTSYDANNIFMAGNSITDGSIMNIAIALTKSGSNVRVTVNVGVTAAQIADDVSY